MANQKPTARWRLVVIDAGKTHRYPQASYEDAYAGWVVLHDHARDDVTFTLQRRLAGRWVDVAEVPPPPPATPDGGAA